jgi:N-hydroxyarylamine O-acetyltransferase
MDIDAYLSRIAYDGPMRKDLSTMAALHRAHLRAIPYENLDVQLGRPVTIERPAIYEKIVTHKRGGWCYEMNGLFGWALSELGFKVTRSAGAVMREARGEEAVGNHLVLKVELEEGIFLADVGFGDGPIDPLFVVEGSFLSNGFEFALSRLDDGWWRLHNHKAGGAASFDFDMTSADEGRLAERCFWLQSAAESPFVENAVLQRHVPEGLWMMRGRVLRKVTPAEQMDYLIESAPEYVGVLSEVYGLHAGQPISGRKSAPGMHSCWRIRSTLRLVPQRRDHRRLAGGALDARLREAGRVDQLISAHDFLSHPADGIGHPLGPFTPAAQPSTNRPPGFSTRRTRQWPAGSSHKWKQCSAATPGSPSVQGSASATPHLISTRPSLRKRQTRCSALCSINSEGSTPAT